MRKQNLFKSRKFCTEKRNVFVARNILRIVLRQERRYPLFVQEENLSFIEGSDPFPKQVRKEAEQGYCSPTVITVSGWPDERS